MNIGWIKLNRKIFENWLWADGEPFDKRSAWIDLLLLANHKDHKILHNGKEIEVKRGEVNRSLLQLSQRWRWSRGKTRRFISVLEAANMVNRNSTTDGTTLTIINYSVYQDSEPTNDTTDGTTSGTKGGTTVSQRSDIYKNDKKENNEKNHQEFHFETNADRAGMTLKDFIKAKTKGEIK